MTEFILVNGELFQEHDHEWRMDVKGHIPYGPAIIPYKCKVCKLVKYDKGFVDGHGFRVDEIIYEEELYTDSKLEILS